MPTKILAIDDSKTMRLAIKITFAAEDAEVTSVGKGGDAVARAKQLGAEIVIVDHTLGAGDPSGYEVCTALKSDPGTSSIPVLVLVSSQKGVDQGKLADARADGWLAKPFDTQELIDKVAELVAGGVAKPAAAAAAAAPAARPVAAPPSVAAKPAPAPAPPRAAAPAKAPPAAAARPPVSAPAAPAPAARAAATPAVAAPSRPTARTTMGMPTPVPKTPPPSGDGHANIPIAIPIPFTAASAPTSGMLARIQAAAGSGVDPKVAEAIAALSREVIERVVWEVVPELAESIIKQSQARSA